jgi:DNA-binding beta-propeller fold protein YncE
MKRRLFFLWTLGIWLGICAHLATAARASVEGQLPDGRLVTPVGYTIPVEGFASSLALSPDKRYLAVLSQQGGAIDVLLLGEDSRLVARLAVPWATGMAWTADGLFVTRGYSGLVSRFTYTPSDADTPSFAAQSDINVGGLLNGIADDPNTHRLAVAQTAMQQVVVLDDRTGAVIARLPAFGQPFATGFCAGRIVATLFDSDRVAVWEAGSTTPRLVNVGPHPTRLLVHGSTLFVADANGHDVVAVDPVHAAVVRRFDLAPLPGFPFGQTPAGMAVSDDGRTFFVAESGLNDVAIVDLARGTVVARIPTGQYAADVAYLKGATIDKDPRIKPQLFILSAQGAGEQPDPGSEWDGWYTGLVQHVVLDAYLFARWTQSVARNNRLTALDRPPAAALPPIRHIVFIVKENKHFDEEFGGFPGANGDPTLELYGPRYTPNAHALAARYVLFDNFMGNGDNSDLGHSWTTQGIADDYLERSVNTPDDPAAPGVWRIAGSIWPVSRAGEDTIARSVMNFDWFRNLQALPAQPRVNVSAIFGPRGELIDELLRAGISFRVYGEQMTMLPDGRIAPGLAAHADRAYPGAHIDFTVLDTQRARLFLQDVAARGLAAYSYLTLPTDHTAGTKPGFYTPASYVANNDLALGEIIAGLSHRPEWRTTLVFVTMDDPQGTGDHVDSHRMPALAIGPYVRRGFVDHTRYSIPSILRTVEVFYHLPPLNMEDALAPPMLDIFARQPDVAVYRALPSNIPLARNPGKAKTAYLELDTPESRLFPNEEWASIKGARSLAQHLAYVRSLYPAANLVQSAGDP